MPNSGDMIERMVEAWPEADAHHSVRETCEHLLLAALSSLPQEPMFTEEETAELVQRINANAVKALFAKNYRLLQLSRDVDLLREENARLKLLVRAYVDPAEVRADLEPLVAEINAEFDASSGISEQGEN
jgi:hypothetical protein